MNNHLDPEPCAYCILQHTWVLIPQNVHTLGLYMCSCVKKKSWNQLLDWNPVLLRFSLYCACTTLTDVFGWETICKIPHPAKTMHMEASSRMRGLEYVCIWAICSHTKGCLPRVMLVAQLKWMRQPRGVDGGSRNAWELLYPQHHSDNLLPYLGIWWAYSSSAVLKTNF